MCLIVCPKTDVMTRIEKKLAEIILRRIEGLSAGQIAEMMVCEGWADRKICERMAICEEIAELEKNGMPRCEAMEVAARKFCCSYEKARDSFYKTIKNHRK